MKGIFDPYVLRPFDKKLISSLVTRIRTGYFKRKFVENLKYKGAMWKLLIFEVYSAMYRIVLLNRLRADSCIDTVTTQESVHNLSVKTS